VTRDLEHYKPRKIYMTLSTVGSETHKVMVKLYTPCSTTVPPSKTIHVAYIFTGTWSSNNLTKIEYGADCLNEDGRNILETGLL